MRPLKVVSVRPGVVPAPTGAAIEMSIVSSMPKPSCKVTVSENGTWVLIVACTGPSAVVLMMASTALGVEISISIEPSMVSEWPAVTVDIWVKVICAPR